jgi:hypothetical protein
MRALACRFLRGNCYLYLQFILLQNWVPRCTYHFVLYCGIYYVKVTCYSCFDPFFLRSWSFSGGGAFLGCCGVGAVHRSSCWCYRCPCRWAPPTGSTTPCFPCLFQLGPPITMCPPSEGLSFSLSYSLFSLNSCMYVCIEMRFGFVYYIAVM